MLTGDCVTSPLQNAGAIAAAAPIEPYAKLLSQLHAPSGVLAILGNHDVDTDAEHIIEVLQSHSFLVLRDRSLPIERERKRFWFAGVDDILAGKPDIGLALNGIPPAEAVVLLAHEPDWG